MASNSSRRRRLPDGDDEGLEESEFVPGGGYYSSASDTEDEDDRYSLQSRCPRKEDDEEIRPPPQLCRRLEEIVARGSAARLPSPTPSYERYYESDGTVSDGDGHHDALSAGGVDAPARRVHMRVHDYVAVTAGWAATGKRGWSGASNKGKAAHPAVGSSSCSDELISHSMSRATLESAEPTTNNPPLPLALARSNLASSLSKPSTKTTNLQSGGEISSPQSVHNNGPTVPAEANKQADQVVLKLAPVAPPVPRKIYTCKICGKSYDSHQGLGGHAAGHMNRRKEAEAAAAAAAGGVVAARLGGKKSEHPCDRCGKVFPTGVALGGHKRMHYEGPPIVHRRKKRCDPPPPPPALALAVVGMVGEELTLGLGIKAGQTSRSLPATSGCRLRLFGIDIGVAPPAEAPVPVMPEGTETITKPHEEAPVQVVHQGTDTTPHDEEGPKEGSASAMTTEGLGSGAGGQLQGETVEQSGKDSPSKESSN